MGVPRPIRGWRSYGKPKRTEIYLRWSLYLAAMLQPLLVLNLLADPGARDLSPALRWGTAVSAGLGVVLGIWCFRAAIAHYLGRRGLPVGRLAASTGLALASGWSLLLLGPHAGPDSLPFSGAMAPALLTFWSGPVAVALPVRRAALAGVAMLALTAPAAMIAGVDAATTSGLLTGVAVDMTLFGATCRCTAWLTGVVWELDSARETQSRLAVAEERLRFSRDLHDVLGRNLTTIALKSELAVQLARRGRPEAADQMTEVQRIAQESHREVREVVRGYRTADLQAEVNGARAVLRAADVECEIDLGPEDVTLPPATQSVLGWVVREATTNVLRHSEAGRCSVRLRLTADRAVLEVENDGVPDAPEPPRSGGTGLAGLRERLAAHGGELTLPQAAPGSFRLTAAMPLAPAPEVPVR
ncbi:histidine kinase [Kitasatospora atroaurantiaca]|uniref:Two-component system sensor histidine kinase DesK n=1 Tax=Kitasatospora atroaurantiaca TaxID=285545 RepID=A0A561ESD4_9ACTN|nr:sensor histidine kinase [Kitasatospora atroaurantiaca]TWE18522.1 two-component system sensor histidine kinase DesK [Kitasatospora atroaurantiaca]